jgi:hypothetical protein
MPKGRGPGAGGASGAMPWHDMTLETESRSGHTTREDLASRRQWHASARIDHSGILRVRAHAALRALQAQVLRIYSHGLASDPASIIGAACMHVVCGLVDDHSMQHNTILLQLQGNNRGSV